ncbi:MAG: hypothetical protein SGJ19_10980 [Planctomycetia bacterium]|nr:hypothetical protein [Planctomycetia bacterium]
MGRAICLALAVMCGIGGAGLLLTERSEAAGCIIACRNFTYVCGGSDDIDDCIIYNPPQAHDQYYSAVTDGIWKHSMYPQECEVWEGPGGTACPNINPGLIQECVTCVPRTQYGDVPRYMCYITPPSST